MAFNTYSDEISLEVVGNGPEVKAPELPALALPAKGQDHFTLSSESCERGSAERMTSPAGNNKHLGRP